MFLNLFAAVMTMFGILCSIAGACVLLHGLWKLFMGKD